MDDFKSSFIKVYTVRKGNFELQKDFKVELEKDILNNFIIKVVEKHFDVYYVNEYKKLLQYSPILEIPKELNYIKMNLDIDEIDNGEFDLNEIKIIVFDFIRNVAGVLELNIKNSYSYYNRTSGSDEPIKIYINKDIERSPKSIYSTERIFTKLFGD